MIGTVMGCCRGYGYGHGPWCSHNGPGVGYVDAPPSYGGLRRRRRYDEEAPSAHLEDVEGEVREVRHLLEDLRASPEDARS